MEVLITLLLLMSLNIFDATVIERRNNRPSDPDFKPIGIIGAPFSFGQNLRGVEGGPDRLRNGGLWHDLREDGCFLIDYKDIGFLNDDRDSRDDCERARHSYSVAEATRLVQAAFDRVLSNSYIPLLLGGDSSVTMGAILAHADYVSELTILWIDAHPAIQTISDSRTGFMADMPLSFLIKDDQLQETNLHCPAMAEFKPVIPARNIALIATRNISADELETLNRLNIKVFDMNAIRLLGVRAVVNQALIQINPLRNKPIHVVFDIDAIDPREAPSTGDPSPGGLTTEEANAIGQEIANTNQLAALQFVELNPRLGTHNDSMDTVHVANQVIVSFLHNLCQRQP